MPGLGRFPCPSCHYVAGNRRMLARHAVLIHSEKVFKCPLCPFITRYAANWYRHKRDLHGLTKVTNCEICGFFANSTIELAQHKESEHPEELQLDKYEDKYNKEKLRLSGNAEQSSRPAAVEEFVTHLQPDVILDIYNIKSEPEDNEYGGKVNDCVTFSLPTNGSLDTSDENFTPNGHSEELHENSTLNNVDASGNPLRPLKVKRSYNCDLCGLLTGNPREFLFHQRDIHSEKINIFECKYCIYASKHIQKLTRHCNLVHKQLLETDPDYKKQLEANKKVKQSDMFNLNLVPQNNFAYVNFQPNQQQQVVKKPPKRNQVFFNCSQCEYKTRNKSFLLHHEKTAHVKKRLYRCLQCGYVTNEKGRYTKHIKYHTLPKMQCQYCFFKTAYKWNMDRHMKNHEAGAEGAFRCNQCNFTTSTRQSFKSHITHHHNANSLDVEEEEFEEGNEPDGAVEWQDIDVIPLQEDDSSLPLDENVESYNNSDTMGASNVMYNDGQSYDKSLNCKTCNFKANWPFELKKHEEMHRSQKKHPCPLCGMRFEHIAWLTKHLRRVHQENSQAGNIAAAFELMKPNRRKPAQKEYNTEAAVLPMYQQVLNKNSANKHQLQTNQNSMLSTLLNKPLNPNPAVPLSADKYMYKSKAFASSTNMSRHLRTSGYNEVPQGNDSSNMPVSKPKSVPTCNVCGYKTRWLSELQRHMRVHSQEKPFHCPKCKYHCKWKGDLNRHLMKYHGIKVPSNNSKKTPVSKLKFSNSNSLNNSSDNWPVSDLEGNNVPSPPTRRQEDEHPLDLTLKDAFAASNSDIYDPYEFESFPSNDSSLEEPLNDMEIEPITTGTGYDLVPYKSPLQQLSEQPVPGEENSPNPSTKRKYQCPFCTFSTTTASRFHVHIVQHYNRRPFMCSVCNHSSNWEWDITKHIRLKNCRDKYNNKACVLLTDETGRRNYDKYDKYLVDINHQPTSPRIPVPKASEPVTLPEPDVRRSVSRSSYVEPPQPKNCTYDFRNIGSNFEDRNIGSNFEDAPENIVVTPDINLPDPLEAMAPAENNQFSYTNQYTMSGNYGQKSNDSKLFACKHCDFKHATKRVVISHLSLHTGIKPYRCRACGICSNWRHVIVRHVKDAHNGYMNEVEDRISYIQEGYILRIAPPGTTPNKDINSFPPESNHTPLSFECKVCPYKCDKEFYMKFHMKQHKPREGAIFKCDYCPYYVKFKKTLVRHLKLHDPAVDVNLVNENPDISSTSNVSFESKALEVENDLCALYSPQDSPEDSINISFDTLNQYSSSETSSPQRAKRHICEGCPYKTDNKTQYLYHKQFHRPNPSAPFKCDVCSYWATMQHLLTQHMKVHEQESEQSSPHRRQSRTTPERTRFDDDEGCDKMSILYVKRGDLVIKMFKCGYCPMMNKKKANVRVHQKMHGVIVNNGKFACSYCDYQCLNQGGLTNHLKIHQKTQEKLTIIEERGIQKDNSRKKQLDTSAEETSVRKRVNLTCSKCPAVFKTAAHLENHSKFHGSFLPYPCSFCDYRARHKPHLIKHELVHSAEYAEKQNASQKVGNSETSNVLSSVDGDTSASGISIVKKIDQMLLLEEKELNAALKKTGNEMNSLHRCILCPAIFIKQATLVYHASLHGSDGEYKCPHCDYAVNRSPNLTAHVLVHPKKSISRTPTKKLPPSKKVPLKIFPCSKCPAVFYKQDRFDRHFNLHGKNWKFVCDYCDYSVRFAANLIKHKKIHLSKNDSENTAPATVIENSVPVVTAATAPLSENAYYDLDDKKLMYVCDRCPYAMNRKDAVQSHMRRHWLKDGFKCPYCDYSSMQSGFLQTHIKTHIQPTLLFPAQCFMKFESFKICCKDEKGQDIVLFDDETMSNSLEEEEEEERESESEATENTENSQASKIRRLSCDSSSTTTDSNFSDTKTKVPVVVLSDIFTSKNKAVRKWVPKLKIPKIKITKSSSNEKLYTKINISEYDEETKSDSSISKSKPSLVVKISKVEGLNNREKATYSICTKTSDDSFSSASSPSPASCSSSSNKVGDSEVSKQVENTTPEPDTNKTSEDGSTIEMDSNSSSTCEIDINMDTINGVEPSVPSDQCSSEIEIKTMLESNESCFAGVKVPLNEISNDKPSTFNDITFDDKLPPALTNTHLSNGLSLMPEEIKVDL